MSPICCRNLPYFKTLRDEFTMRGQLSIIWGSLNDDSFTTVTQPVKLIN